jgi:uncharacterized protein (DUF1778 family)
LWASELTGLRLVRTIALQEVGSVSAETINMRTDAERKRRLQAAADHLHVSLTVFVLSAADEKAERVLAESRSTPLPAEFFDGFFDSLAPEPTPSLVDAAARLSKTVRR